MIGVRSLTALATSYFTMFSKRKAMDPGKRPAFHEGHAAPLIQVLAWLFLACSTLSVIAQFATKRAMSRSLVGADYVLLVALVSFYAMRTCAPFSNAYYCRFSLQARPRPFSAQPVKLSETPKLNYRRRRSLRLGR
jgi:hypothetical protein